MQSPEVKISVNQSTPVAVKLPVYFDEGSLLLLSTPAGESGTYDGSRKRGENEGKRLTDMKDSKDSLVLFGSTRVLSQYNSSYHAPTSKQTQVQQAHT